MQNDIERLSTGIPDLDSIMQGGIPRGFLVAVTGEPGTGKTILCIHFLSKGIEKWDRCVYVTMEESRDSIVRQARQFNINLASAVKRNAILIDALMGLEDKWSLKSLDVEELVNKVIDAKKELGYGRGRLIIDSLSAFWLDRPAMARRYSYFVKKVITKWDFTILATSQYAITTSDTFGFGIEHISDGIIRFRRSVREGFLKRFLLIEKMRQTKHSLYMHEINLIDGKGLVLVEGSYGRREDVKIPPRVTQKILKAERSKEAEIPQ